MHIKSKENEELPAHPTGQYGAEETQEFSFADDKELDPLQEEQYETLFEKERKREIKELDAHLDKGFKCYQILLIIGIIIACINVVFELTELFTPMGLVQVTFRTFEIYVLSQAWAAFKRRELKFQRQVVRYFKVVLVVSCFILVGSLVVGSSQIITQPKRTFPLPISENPNQDDKSGPKEDAPVFGNDQVLSPQVHGTILIVLGFLGVMIALYLYNKARAIEMVIERKYLLKRDLGMPRLFSWE